MDLCTYSESEQKELTTHLGWGKYIRGAAIVDINDVPEAERKEAARQVADSVLAALSNGGQYDLV